MGGYRGSKSQGDLVRGGVTPSRIITQPSPIETRIPFNIRMKTYFLNGFSIYDEEVQRPDGGRTLE